MLGYIWLYTIIFWLGYIVGQSDENDAATAFFGMLAAFLIIISILIAVALKGR